MGRELAFAALQAVVAVHISGETKHHVAGIHSFLAEGGSGTQTALARKESLAVRRLLLLWLVIDEISMVRTHLSSQVDTSMRNAMRQSSTRSGAATVWRFRSSIG